MQGLISLLEEFINNLSPLLTIRGYKLAGKHYYKANS
jgi:hypothetical protein